MLALALCCKLLRTHTQDNFALLLYLFQTTEQLARAANIVIWNRWLMTSMGLWPFKVNWALFAFCSGYTAMHCTMGARHLIKYFDDPEYIVANLTENVLFVMMLGKILVCGRSCKAMVRFLEIIENHFSDESFGTVQERTAYLRYNGFALMFIKVLVALCAFSAAIYYLKAFVINWSERK